MSTDTMSTNGFILLNSKGREIENLVDIEIDNQSYDYSSPVKRPDFFTPAPVSPKKAAFEGPFKLRRETNWKCVSTLGKRKFHEAFDSEDDERYGQHIGADFFAINVGHNVVSSPIPDNWEEQSWNEYIQKEGKRERDSYDPEEILAWVEFYRNNRNLYNV